MLVPRIYFLEEPDDFLKLFLHFSRFERANSADNFDIMIYPILLRLENYNFVLDVSEYSKNIMHYDRDKPVIMFAFNDYEMIIESTPNPTIIYRTGISRSWKLPNELVMPYLWIVQPDKLEIAEMRDKPVVSFCGTLLGRRSRKVTLKYLRSRTDFQCNFVIRDRFAGGTMPRDQAVAEFFDNLENSHFVVCDRGRGNWTIRIYEALSRGRVPVLYDSGGYLGKLKNGTWNEAIVVGRTRKELVNKMKQVWAGDFVARQHYCRSLWENNLSILGFADVFSTDIASFAHQLRRGKRLYKYSILQKAVRVLRNFSHRPRNADEKKSR